MPGTQDAQCESDTQDPEPLTRDACAAAGLGPPGCCGWPRVTQESGGFLEARAWAVVLGAWRSIIFIPLEVAECGGVRSALFLE